MWLVLAELNAASVRQSGLCPSLHKRTVAQASFPSRPRSQATLTLRIPSVRVTRAAALICFECLYSRRCEGQSMLHGDLIVILLEDEGAVINARDKSAYLACLHLSRPSIQTCNLTLPQNLFHQRRTET